MSACEKCWRDANLRAATMGGTVSDHYRALLDERKDNPCQDESVTDDSGRIVAPAQHAPAPRPDGPWRNNRNNTTGE